MVCGLLVHSFAWKLPPPLTAGPLQNMPAGQPCPLLQKLFGVDVGIRVGVVVLVGVKVLVGVFVLVGVVVALVGVVVVLGGGVTVTGVLVGGGVR